jgi:anaerobic C4-dicarboxylate transporter
MNTLVQLIIYLLLGGVIIWLTQWILSMVTLDGRLKQAILVVVAVLVIVWLVTTFLPRLT